VSLKRLEWEPDTCGCAAVQYVDMAVPFAERVLTFGGFIRSCPAHAGIADPAARYEQMRMDCRAKNWIEKALHAHDRFAEDHRTEQGDLVRRLRAGVEYRWSLSGLDTARTLTVEVVGVAALTPHEIQALHIAVADVPVTLVVRS
jgi:hypothetical protein